MKYSRHSQLITGRIKVSITVHHLPPVTTSYHNPSPKVWAELDTNEQLWSVMMMMMMAMVENDRHQEKSMPESMQSWVDTAMRWHPMVDNATTSDDGGSMWIMVSGWSPLDSEIRLRSSFQVMAHLGKVSLSNWWHMPQPIFQIKNWREWLWTFSDLFFKPLKNQRRFHAKNMIHMDPPFRWAPVWRHVVLEEPGNQSR